MPGFHPCQSFERSAKCLEGGENHGISPEKGKADPQEWTDPASREGGKAKKQDNRRERLGQEDEIQLGPRGVRSGLTWGRGGVCGSGWTANVSFLLE